MQHLIFHLSFSELRLEATTFSDSPPGTGTEEKRFKLFLSGLEGECDSIYVTNAVQ